MNEIAQRIFATAATCDRVDAGVGIIWWTLFPRGPFLLNVLDYDVVPMTTANDKFIEALFYRAAELIGQHRPLEKRCMIWCEAGGLLDHLRLATRAWFGAHPGETLDTSTADIGTPAASDVAKWPPTLDGRAALVRPLVNSGTTIRIETGLRQFSFRSIRTNHLIAAIKNHRPGEPATATELMNAFILGILLERESDRRMRLPDFAPTTADGGDGLLTRMAAAIRQALAPSATPAARKPSPPGLWLAPGDWMIDEHPVTVVAGPDGTGFVALVPGGHIVRRANTPIGTIMRVDNPAARVRVL